MKRNYVLCITFVIPFLSSAQTTEFRDVLAKNSSMAPKTINVLSLPQSAFDKKRWFIMQPPTDDQVYIDFVGKGDIQKSISQGEDISANTGVGIIFERFGGYYKAIQSFELEATINIASTADTISSAIVNNILQNRRSFGSYVLNPISTKQALFINSNVYFGYPKDKDNRNVFGKIASVLSGLNFRIISSNTVWQYNSNAINLGALAFRGGIFHEFMPDNHRLVTQKGSADEGRSKYSIFLGINYTYRGIFGDVTSPLNRDFRINVLGTDRTDFNGLEANFGFRLNNLRAEFQMPILKAIDNSIDGLTDTQFIFSIRFVGGFSLRLNEKSTNAGSGTGTTGG